MFAAWLSRHVSTFLHGSLDAEPMLIMSQTAYLARDSWSMGVGENS